MKLKKILPYSYPAYLAIAVFVMALGLYFTKGEFGKEQWMWINGSVFIVGLPFICLSEIANIESRLLRHKVLVVMIWLAICSTLFRPIISYYTFIAFGLYSIFYAIREKKIYRLHSIFYLLFAYGLLQTLGTFSTPWDLDLWITHCFCL